MGLPWPGARTSQPGPSHLRPNRRFEPRRHLVAAMDRDPFALIADRELDEGVTPAGPDRHAIAALRLDLDDHTAQDLVHAFRFLRTGDLRAGPVTGVES
jgi:hypothetical protein